MKKIMFIAVFFSRFNSFANDIKEDKKMKKLLMHAVQPT